MHGPTLHAEAPYTFFLPRPALIDAVQEGDLVKLGFLYDEPGEKWSAERMWVQVDNIHADRYVGRLDNEPDEPILQYGEEVSFNRDNILDARIDPERLSESDKQRLAADNAPREYWDRCLVDDCVLNDGIPVEYLYREKPDLAGPDDEHPDSGWRLRGKEEKGDDMDAREPAYVALGAVLNRDDSWLHLIDAPIGSAFMRNFETGEYVGTT